jgi:hypothetical protein
MGEKRNAYRVFIMKIEGKKQLGICRDRCKDSTRWFKYDRD